MVGAVPVPIVDFACHAREVGVCDIEMLFQSVEIVGLAQVIESALGGGRQGIGWRFVGR